MRCILIGNYGVGNLGDEALKEYFLSAFPEITWTVVSAHPDPHEVPRLPFGLRSLFAPWWRTLRALRRCDAVVFGGGSLFTDVESSKACFLWWWHGFVARLFGKPLVLAFQGIGPFMTVRGEWCARWILKRTAFVSVRDQESAERVGVWIKDGLGVMQTFDPVLSLLTLEKQPSGDTLAVIPRMNSRGALEKAAKDLLMLKQPEEIRILSMQPEDAGEWKVCERLRDGLRSEASVHPVRSIHDLTRELLKCSSAVTERYHGALAAAAMGIPVEIVSQGLGDKLDELKNMLKSGVMIEELRARVKAGEDGLRTYLSQL